MIQAVRGARNHRALAYFVLAAFLLQGFLTQSHIHRVGPAQASSGVSHEGMTAVAFSLAGKPGSKKLPTDRGDAYCPICFAASMASAFYAPPVPILRVPSLSTYVLRLDERSIAVERFTAAWRSRAPPSL